MNNKYGPLLSTSHREAYHKNYLITKALLSALCFNNRFAWSMDRYYQYLEIEGCSCLYCEGEEGITSQHLVYPLGDLTISKMKNIADFYYPAFQEKNNPLKLMFVPSDRLELFKELNGYNIEVVNKPDFDEYVYMVSSLKEMKGKRLKSKKNHLNRFFRECDACEYKILTKDNREDCLRLAKEWGADRNVDKDDVLLSDYTAIRVLFDHFDELTIRGGAIWLYNKLIAFSIGSEPLDGTAFIHFEKVDHVIAGANVAIVVTALENTYPDAKFINREEDMGIEGLRIAKQSYNPAYMTIKNDLFLTKLD